MVNEGFDPIPIRVYEFMTYLPSKIFLVYNHAIEDAYKKLFRAVISNDLYYIKMLSPMVGISYRETLSVLDQSTYFDSIKNMFKTKEELENAIRRYRKERGIAKLSFLDKAKAKVFQIGEKCFDLYVEDVLEAMNVHRLVPVEYIVIMRLRLEENAKDIVQGRLSALVILKTVDDRWIGLIIPHIYNSIVTVYKR